MREQATSAHLHSLEDHRQSLDLRSREQKDDSESNVGQRKPMTGVFAGTSGATEIASASLSQSLDGEKQKSWS